MPFTDRVAFVTGEAIADQVGFMVQATSKGHVVRRFENAAEAVLWLQAV